MSSETIDGLRVVSQKPAKNLAHTLQVELEDGSHRYVCSEDDCTYVMKNEGQARGHRKKHTLTLGGALKDVTVGTLVEAYKAYQGPQEDTATQDMAERLVDMQNKHRQEKEKIRAQEKKKRQQILEQNRELRKENKRLRTIVENIQKATSIFEPPTPEPEPASQEEEKTQSQPEPPGEGLVFRESIKT